MFDSQLRNIRVLLVASDPGIAETIRLHVGQAFLLSLVDTAFSVTEAREKVPVFLPDVVLIAEPTPEFPLETDVYSFCRELAFDYPGIAPILLLEHIGNETLEAALDSGARGVVQITRGSDGWYVLGEQLESRVRQAFDMVSQRRGEQWAWNQLFDRRRSVALMSGSGGVGKSLIAALLSIRIASYATQISETFHTTPEISLMDADLGGGVQHLLFDIEPAHTLADIAHLDRGLDRASTRLFSHEIRFPASKTQDGRIHLVASPELNSDNASLTPSQMANVMSVIRNAFDFLVVDTRTSLTPASWPILQTCSHVWIVCTPDIISVYQTRRLIDAMLQKDEGGLRSKLGVIINRIEKKREISPEDVKFVFEKERIPVLAEIWNDTARVESYLNQGELYPLTFVPKPKKRRRKRKKKKQTEEENALEPMPLNQAIDTLSITFLSDLFSSVQEA